MVPPGGLAKVPHESVVAALLAVSSIVKTKPWPAVWVSVNE